MMYNYEEFHRLFWKKFCWLKTQNLDMFTNAIILWKTSATSYMVFKGFWLRILIATKTDGMRKSSNRRNMEYSIDVLKIEEIIVERGSMASEFFVNLLEHTRSIEKSLEFPASVLWRKMEECKPLQYDDCEIPDPELVNCLQTEIEVKCHIRTYTYSCELVACEDQVDERKINWNVVGTIEWICTVVDGDRHVYRLQTNESNLSVENGDGNVKPNLSVENDDGNAKSKRCAVNGCTLNRIEIETIVCNRTLSRRRNCLDKQRQSMLESLLTVELLNQLVHLTLANFGSVNMQSCGGCHVIKAHMENPRRPMPKERMTQTLR